jgi:hypothetical protein
MDMGEGRTGGYKTDVRIAQSFHIKLRPSSHTLWLGNIQLLQLGLHSKPRTLQNISLYRDLKQFTNQIT